MNKTVKWIKNDRLYTLEDIYGNVLLTIKDNTCNGNAVTQDALDKYKEECLKELVEKENEKGSN